MSGPPSAPTLADLFTEWRLDLLSAVLIALLTAGYIRARMTLRGTGRPWPAHRDVVYGIGIVLTAWVTNGFPEARAHQLMWVWTSQQLALLLALPVVLMAGQPVALARAARGESALPVRILESRPLRAVGHPALGMLYVPIIASLLFFGGVGNAAVQSTLGTGALHVVLLGLGMVIALPLVDIDDPRSSLAVGVTVAIGVVELVVDAIPGIVLRLETHLEMPVFGVGRPPWSPSWLADQQNGGAILWTVAELLDMPFLVLMIVQWIRVERREAARIDIELDRAELQGAAPGDRSVVPDPGERPANPTPPAASRPWWLDDPQLRARFGGAADDGRSAR